MPLPLVEGFMLNIGLIIAIGPQNLFVLKQGLFGKYPAIAALACTCCDLFLINLGALGLGSAITHIPWLRQLAIWGGALFLVIFGLRSWINIYRGKVTVHIQSRDASQQETVKTVILMALGFSLLNPHALLDTIVLIGGLAARFEAVQDRMLFALGAGIISAIWFFGLAYGARLLRPLFQIRTTAVAFELLSGCLLFWISWGLIQNELLVFENSEPIEEVISYEPWQLKN